MKRRRAGGGGSWFRFVRLGLVHKAFKSFPVSRVVRAGVGKDQEGINKPEKLCSSVAPQPPAPRCSAVRTTRPRQTLARLS